MDGYISFIDAASSQGDALNALVPRIRRQLTELAAKGALTGPGPVLLGIGASLSAAAPALWHLRSRGVMGWRLGAGDTPLPIASGRHPVVAISQSGRSAETIAALETVDPVLRYAVVNSVPSPLASLATHSIELGNIDDSYASTIGYTATVTAVSMLAEAWAEGHIDPAWDSLGTTFHDTEQGLNEALDETAQLFVEAPSVDFVGAGPSVGSAEAGALLFREVTRIPASAMGTRQYLHGSMESAGEGIHVLFGREREALVARMLGDAGHRVVLVTEDVVSPTRNVDVLRLTRASDTARAVLEAAVLQGLVRRVASLRSIDIEEFVFHNDDTKVDPKA